MVVMSNKDRLYWDEAWDRERASRQQKQARPQQKGQKKGARWDPFISNCCHWRQPFDLEDGLRVFASASMDRPNERNGVDLGGFTGLPDVGLYLDTRWGSDQLLVSPGTVGHFTRGCSSKTQVVLFPWPDYGLPQDERCLLKVLRWLLVQASKGRTVEIGCMGGHGRTGTVLAALLILQGLPSQAATRRVWRRYCENAIESEKQLAFLRALR